MDLKMQKRKLSQTRKKDRIGDSYNYYNMVICLDTFKPNALVFEFKDTYKIEIFRKDNIKIPYLVDWLTDSFF